MHISSSCKTSNGTSKYTSYIERAYIYRKLRIGNPAIGNREPGTGEREPGNENKEPGTINRKDGTGKQEPETGNQELGTGNHEPGTGNQEPGTYFTLIIEIESQMVNGVDLPVFFLFFFFFFFILDVIIA